MGSTTGFDRRGFLRGLGSTALVGAFGGIADARADEAPRRPRPEELLDEAREGLARPPVPTARRGTERYWRQVRQAFLLPDRYIHLNTGTTGSQPRFSLVNLAVYNLYKSLDPRDWEANLNAAFPDLFPVVTSASGALSGVAARQAAIAAQYGANADEIVLSYNTTDASNLIFAGTPWSAGDRIITTHWEHPALRGPTAWARDQFGVEVREIGLPSRFTRDITREDVLGLFEEELERPLPPGAKQYVAVSEIFYKTGLRLPIEELSALARSHGAYTIIDAAHGWGQRPIDAHAYGADFIAGAGHKWLCGGPGTGILYVRNSGPDLPPFLLGNFFQYASVDAQERAYAPASAIQPRGEANTPALYAMTDSAAFLGQIGLQDIYERGLALARHLRRRVAARWGRRALWVEDHPDPAFATALTSFNPFVGREDSSQFAALNAALGGVLRALASERPKIYLRTTTWRDQPSDLADNRVGFRISTHGLYNTFEEIDYVLERLAAAVDATGLPQLS